MEMSRFVKKVLCKATVTEQDPLFYMSKDLALSVADCEEALIRDPVESWSDHMDFADG